MVTEQEIQQIASQRVPRRSFGSRIGAKEQQNIIENKQKAQEVLVQINQPQQQTQQAQTRDQLKQSALNYLLAKGKANEAFRNLTPKEQEEVQNQANDLERTRSRIQAIRAVSQVEQQGGISLNPQIREQLINQAIETGQIKFTLNQGRQELYSPVKNQQVSSLDQQQTMPSRYQQVINRLFPPAEPTQFAIEKFGQERAQKIATDIRSIGVAGALSLSGTSAIPKVIKAPIRPLTEPTFIEVQQPVIIGGEVKTFASYEIFSERIPPQVILDSREIGGLLGSSPSFSIQPAKYEITSTVVPITQGKPFFTITTKGKDKFLLDLIKGNAINIKPNQINKLPKVSQFLFKRLTGSDIYVENVGKVLSKTDTYSLGGIVKNNLGTGLPEKTISRFQTVSRTKLLSSGDEFDLYQSKVYFKDVSKGGAIARATGKTPSMTGYTRVYQEPIVLDKELSEFTKSKGSTKTPFSKTFSQIEEQIKTELIEIPKPIPRTPKTPEAKTISTKASPLGSGVSSLLSRSSSGSAYGTSSDFSSDFLRGVEDFTSSKTSAQPKEKLNFNNLSLEKNLPSQINIPRPTQLSINVPREVPREISRNVPKEIPREVPREISREVQKEIQKQLSKSIAKQISKNLPKSIARSPLLTKTNRSKSLEKLDFNKSYKRGTEFIAKGYKTYYFTKGNKVYLPSISTKEEAIFKGQKATLNSLSARFGIEETKGLIKDNNVNAPDRYSKYFRNYKISKGKRINTPNVFIQKLGKRLSTKTERGLIQKARRGR